MAITAAQVKQLRELTGAGIMECKKALTKTEGDIDAAVEELRKAGAAKAEKKANRIAAEGLCYVSQKNEKEAAVSLTQPLRPRQPISRASSQTSGRRTMPRPSRTRSST